MSCRVLGRKVEHMVLRHLVEQAQARGVHTLVGRYLPTDRNKLVVDHYAKLGFERVSAEESGRTEWKLDVASAQIESAPMKVVQIES